MTDDIVIRLRDRYPNVVHPHILRDAELVGEAAVEIEMLRTEIERLRAEVARLNTFLHPIGVVINQEVRGE